MQVKQKLKKLKVGDVVRVRWNDAMGVTQGWHDRSGSNMKLALITSRGVVWKLTKRTLAICPHIDAADDEGVGVMFIPRCAVRAIKRID